MPRRNHITTLAIFTLSLMLSACGLFSEQDSNVITDAKQLLEEQKDASGEPINVKLPLRLNYAITRKPMIDEKLEIEFEILTEQPIPVFRVGVDTTEGLELVDNDFREKFVDLTIRQIINRKVIVRPTLENKFYLQLYLITEIGEDKKAKLVRIPIAVGDYSLTDNPPPRPIAIP